MLKVEISSASEVLEGNEEALKSDGKALMVDEENLKALKGNEDSYKRAWGGVTVRLGAS